MRPTLLLVLLAVPTLAAPPQVVVVKPVEREVFDHADITGRTAASTTVEIRSRLAGQLDKVLFKEGAAVKKGDMLFLFDDRLQRAEVEKVQAEMARMEARLKVAELDYRRLVKLGEAKSVPQDEVARTAAALEDAKAAHLAAQAALNVARLQLEWTRVVSPIDGRIGRAKSTAGSVVRSADLLATVYAVDPLYVYFDLDERNLLRLVRHTRGRPDDKVSVGLALTGDEGFPHKAVVDFLEPAVDPKTQTLRVRAVLPNPKDEVRPGQTVRVRVPLGVPRKALLLQFRGGGVFRVADREYVLVVNERNILEEKTVVIGADGEVLKGLDHDDRVVDTFESPRGLKAGDEVRPKPDKDTPATGPKPGGHGFVAPPVPPLPEFPASGPALVVTAKHPGATAHVVEDTVAAPVGQQLNGLERLKHRVLACSSDGTMRLTLLFEPGTDLNIAAESARKRIALAEPTLPEVVRRQGITIKKPGVHLAAVAVLSPNERYDRDFLARYAKARIPDELARVPGLAGVTFYGDTEPGKQVRLDIDREKMARMGLTVAGLMNALRLQNIVAEAGGGRQLSLTLAGRLPDPVQLGRLEVANDKGQKVPVGAVARIEVGEGWANTTDLDGKPCVLLLVTRLADADPTTTAKALREHVAALAKQAPDGMGLKVIDADQ